MSESSYSTIPSRKTFKELARNFTPDWFAVIMGTGAVSNLFHIFPFATRSTTFTVFTYIFFFLNLVLFIIFTILIVSRFILFPGCWPLVVKDPVQSLYIGCYPMGAATLISLATGLLYEQEGFGGKPFLYILWTFWWIDVFLSLLCAFLIVHVMKTKQDHHLSRMTSGWLLPIVTIIVASSSGGVLAPALLLHTPKGALVTLVAAAFLVSAGLALASMMLTMYLLRLFVYGVPPGASVISAFISLGSMGQAGYSILLLGSGYRTVLPLSSGNSSILRLPDVGVTIDVICVFVGFVLWAVSTMWMFYSVLAVFYVLTQTKLSFKVPVWGLIFPNGVYGSLTIQLGTIFDSKFFHIWGATYAATTLLLWSFVACLTVVYVWRGGMFAEVAVTKVSEKPKQEVTLHVEHPANVLEMRCSAV